MTPAGRSQPKELSLGRVQLQSVAAHPETHVVDALRHNGLQMVDVGRTTPAVHLGIVGVQMGTQPMLFDQWYEVSCIQNEQQRPEYGALRNAVVNVLECRLMTCMP